jgi:hypothetical protein
MKQEAFVSWDRIAGSWRRLKDEIVFQWCRLADDKGMSFDLIGAEMSRDRQSSDVQTSVFRQTTAESGASFHCTLAAN